MNVVDLRPKACVYCSNSEGPFHRDHLIPASRGGADDVENCVLACASCNGNKADQTPSEWQADGLPGWLYKLEARLSHKYKMTPRKRRGRMPKAPESGVEVSKKPREPGLVGLYFHSKNEDGSIHWQGVVEERVDGSTFLVCTFSWFDGRDCQLLLVPLSQMKDWTFYPDAEEMKFQYDNEQRAKDIEYRRQRYERMQAKE